MRVRSSSVSAVALAALIAGCGSSQDPATTATSQAAGSAGQPQQVLNVGVPSTANATSAYLAGQKYFKDEGLTFKPVVVNSGAEAIPMLLKGQLDISLGDGIGTLTAAANGVPIAIIGVATISPTDPKLDPTAVVTADAGTNAADLSGKKVAVSQLGGAAELVTKAAIDAQGGDSSKVTFVELNPAQIAAAIKAGRVAAGLVQEPFATMAEQQGLHVLARPQSEAEPGLPATLFIASQRYAEQHADVIAKFNDAVRKAAKEANGDPAVARKVAATFTGSDAKTLARIRFPVFAEDAAVTGGVKDVLALANKYKLFPKQPDLNTLIVAQPDAGS
jgi:NitT/TauT family transport system substrate-binding protein